MYPGTHLISILGHHIHPSISGVIRFFFISSDSPVTNTQILSSYTHGSCPKLSLIFPFPLSLFCIFSSFFFSLFIFFVSYSFVYFLWYLYGSGYGAKAGKPSEIANTHAYMQTSDIFRGEVPYVL